MNSNLKQKMQRGGVLLLAATMCLTALAGCGDKNKKAAQEKTETAQTETAKKADNSGKEKKTATTQTQTGKKAASSDSEKKAVALPSTTEKKADAGEAQNTQTQNDKKPAANTSGNTSKTQTASKENTSPASQPKLPGAPQGFPKGPAKKSGN